MPDYYHRLSGRKYFEVGDVTILNKDVFSLEYVYFLLHELAVENGYAGSDKDFPEVFFLQRDTGVTELVVWWRLVRPWDKIKYKDPNFHFEMDINIHILAMKPAEVVINNQKLKAHTGEIEIKLTPRLHHDKWANEHTWFKPIKDLLMKRAIKDKFSLYKGEMIKDLYKFEDALKAYFNMDTYSAFHPLQHFYKTREEGAY